MSQQKPEPKKRFERRLVVLSSVMILLSLFLLGQRTGSLTGQLFAREVRKEENKDFYHFSDLFAEVYRDVKDRYVDEVSDKELFQNAIEGMFGALDPHSQFLDPDNYKQLEKETEGEFSGIGIHLALYPKDPDAPPSDENRILTVVAPIPGSPAFEAGVRPWDHVIEIEGKSTLGMTLQDAVRKLSGPEGTKTTITVERKDAPGPLHFTVTRRQIKIESVYSKMLDDNILLVRIARFSDNTTRDLRKAIENGKSKGAKGLVVDLRWDTGGLLKEAISASELFLKKGDVIVSTKGRNKSQNREYKSQSNAIVGWPMLILINKGTASASEIFAGAMRDHNRGLIIGPKGGRTFGKGSVQTIEPLQYSLERDENGNFKKDAIRLTTARYYTPNGTAIDNPKHPEKAGLAPDLEVPITPMDEIELSRRGLLLGEPNMVDPNGKKDGKDPLVTPLNDGDRDQLLKQIEEISGVKNPKVTITVERDDKPALHYSLDNGELAAAEMVDVQLQFAVEQMKRIFQGKKPETQPAATDETTIAQNEKGSVDTQD